MNHQILVVDDEPTMCRVLELTLGSEGYTVKCEFSGSAAIKQIASNQFGLVITDANLRDMSGDDVARVAKSRVNPPAVVLITGQVNALGNRTLYDATLTKPFEVKEIRSLIATLLKKKLGQYPDDKTKNPDR